MIVQISLLRRLRKPRWLEQNLSSLWRSDRSKYATQFAKARFAYTCSAREQYWRYDDEDQGIVHILRAGCRTGTWWATHFPHYGRGMACTGDYDLVCCGYSHVDEVIRQPNIKGGETMIVNRGSVSCIGAHGVKEAFT